MTTATLQREINEVKKTQKRLELELNTIKKIIDEHAFEEIRPEYLKKLDKISAEINKGKGIKFSSQKELKNYFKNL
ncbi:MAG: hypothetical protein AAB556_00715 [Patescibacteria group bacterium]